MRERDSAVQNQRLLLQEKDMYYNSKLQSKIE